MPKLKNSEQICAICGQKVMTSVEASAYRPSCLIVVHTACAELMGWRCPSLGCNVRLVLRRGREMDLQVSGTNAHEVEKITTSLMAEAETSQSLKQDTLNPWFSGSFYLFAVVVLLLVVLVIARTVHIIVLPIVLIFGVLSLSFIGALQLRQDSRLSEKNFLTLMLESLKLSPLLRHKNGTSDENKSAK